MFYGYKLDYNEKQASYFDQNFCIEFDTSDRFYEMFKNRSFRRIQPDCRHELHGTTLSLFQNDDITIKKYTIGFSVQNGFVSVLSHGKKCTIQPLDASGIYRVYAFDFDIDDPLEKIYYEAASNSIDPIEIEVQIVKADVYAYHKRKEEETAQQHRAELIQKAGVSCATGDNLVNVYFQPCSEGYDHAEVLLYRESRLIAKYQVSREVYFLAISGLANGQYEFFVKQYDAKGETIFESDKQSFIIRSAARAQKPVNRIC